MPLLNQARADLRAIVGIGWPLIINNLASIGVAVADTLMASHLGPLQLAAVAVGSGVWIAVFLLGLGVIMALGPTVAQHYGAGRHVEIGRDMRQALWLSAVISFVVICTMRSVSPVLAWVGIDAAVIQLAQGYLDALSWGVPGAYAYHAVKQMNEGVGRTVPIMVVMGTALPINILLNYGFMFGRFGTEPLGAVGCGLGSGIAFWLMFLMLALHSVRSPHYRRFELWRGPARPEAATLRRLLLLGVPIGLSLFLQSGLFTAVALLMGALGTAAVAAHQIVLNYSGLVFMLPLGFAMALTVRVGQAVGRGEPAAARRIGFTGMLLCGACALASATVTWLFADLITRTYAHDPQVAAVTLLLMKVAAWLQIADGVQVAAAFALRGLKDTRIPLLLNAFNYWGVGFSLAYGLGLQAGAGPAGIWLGLTAALWGGGACLIVRFVVVTRRLVAAQGS